MRAVRLLSVPALCLLLTLTACSGDDDEPDGDSSSSAGAEADDDGERTKDKPVGDVQRVCQAVVDVTGTVEASWEGPGNVRLTSDGERAVYESLDADARVVIYSAGGDFETASANFSDGEQTYTTPLGDGTGLKAKVNGKSASADAQAAGIEGDPVQISADFTCGRTRVE